MTNERSCEYCEHCIYVGDGGFWCEEHEDMVADDWDFSDAEICDKYDEEEE